MSNYSSERKQLVDHGLTSTTVAKYYEKFLGSEKVDLSFKYHGHNYTYSDIKKIADLLDSGSILVVPDKSLPQATATYIDGRDVLFVSMDMLSVPVALYPRVALLHEVIHMINDMRGKPLNKLQDEKTAYLFAAYYCRKNGMSENNFKGARNTTFFPAVFKLFDNLNSTNATLLKQLEDNLTKEMQKIPEYKNILEEKSVTDGIGEPKPHKPHKPH